MTGSILLIIGWILIVASTAMLLGYRLLLHRYDQRLLRLAAPGYSTPLHAALQNRMTHIDRWGISLTVVIGVYTVLFPVYLFYRAFARVAQSLMRLLSFI